MALRILLVLTTLAAATAQAAPLRMTHYGFLLDSADHPVTNTALALRFKIWNARLAGQDGEETVWQSGACNVAVKNGYYSAVLGDTCNGEVALDTTHVLPGQLRFLEVTIDGNALQPRLPIGTVPTAAVAQRSLDTEKLEAAISTAGTLNDATNPMDWTKLKGVPASIADGDDDTTYTAAEGGGLSLLDGAFSLAADPASLAKISGNKIVLSTSGELTIAAPKITGGSLTGANFTAGSISGGTIAGAAITGGSLDVSGAQLGGATLTNPTITGGTLTGVSLANAQISGALKLGDSTTCANGDRGNVRYTAQGRVEVCDGTTWAALGARDTTPDALVFPAISTQAIGTSATSATVTLAGVEGEITLNVTGDGPTRIKLNGGSEVATTRAKNGDTVQLVMRSDGRAGLHTASVSAGDAVVQWSVTYTGAPATCKALLDAGTNANGTYKIDPDGPGGADEFDVFCDMVNGGWTYKTAGVPFRFSFTNGVQTHTTPAIAAQYRFVAFGAQGGLGQNLHGGRGGRVEGTKTFAARTPLFVFVGGQGGQGGAADVGDGSTRVGGFNGGGRGTRGGSGGGGATDVRTSQSDLTTRLLVAAGGGGCGYDNCGRAGGDGGGLTGLNSQTGAGTGQGGTQAAGGVPSSGNTGGSGRLGVGGDNVQINDEGGGGGGYYGGSSGGTDNTGGGGGSSYYGGLDTGATTTAGVQPGDGALEYVFK